MNSSSEYKARDWQTRSLKSETQVRATVTGTVTLDAVGWDIDDVRGTKHVRKKKSICMMFFANKVLRAF